MFDYNLDLSVSLLSLSLFDIVNLHTETKQNKFCVLRHSLGIIIFNLIHTLTIYNFFSYITSQLKI